jgi:transcriptional regulator with XRE-family HTH domain
MMDGIRPRPQWTLEGPETSTMQDHEPTIRSRALGDRLRKVMTAADFNGRQLADRLGWAPSTLSRLLAGKHFGNETDIAALLAVCGVIGGERRHLLRLAKDVHLLGDTVPRRLDTYAEHEAGARRITEFQCVALPDILQTEDHARIQLTATGHTDSEIEHEIKARQERAALFNRLRPPCFEFIVHEWLLRTPVGDRDVMSDQLHHLLRLSTRPFLTLRVLPVSAGAHAAQTGSFRLLDFDGFASVVHRQDEHSDTYVEEPDEVLTCRGILARLRSTALDPDQSRALIAEVVITLWA